MAVEREPVGKALKGREVVGKGERVSGGGSGESES